MREFDDVWFTYKARIAAELRLRNNDIHSQLLLVYYAVVSSGAAIVALRHPTFAGTHTDLYCAVLSVALLAVSMFVATRDYRGRALQIRANHIALKRFYDELALKIVSPLDKPKLYAALLTECENHTSYDDRYFRIFNRAGLQSRKPTCVDYFLLIPQWVMRFGFLTLLYLAPLSIWYI